MSLVPPFEIGVWNAWILAFYMLLHAFLLSLVFKDALQKMESTNRALHRKAEKRISASRMILLILMFAYSVFVPLRVGMPWFYTGLAVYLAGLAMYTMAIATFAATPPEKPATTGLYRFSRHPQYLTQSLAFVGASVASASWVLLLFSAIFIVMLPVSVSFEEGHTIDRFGGAYREYMDRTPRWIGIPK